MLQRLPKYPYNIYLNSPQLAYNVNQRKYYEYVIKQNNKLYTPQFKSYSPLYFSSGYQRIYRPNEIITPF